MPYITFQCTFSHNNIEGLHQNTIMYLSDIWKYIPSRYTVYLVASWPCCYLSSGIFSTCFVYVTGNRKSNVGDLRTYAFYAYEEYPHDDVIKCKHFPRYWPFVRGIHRSPVNSPHKGQWRAALIFSLICVWINGWVNNRETGDLRRYRAHYEVTVMMNVLFIDDTWCSHLSTVQDIAI